MLGFMSVAYMRASIPTNTPVMLLGVPPTPITAPIRDSTDNISTLDLTDNNSTTTLVASSRCKFESSSAPHITIATSEMVKPSNAHKCMRKRAPSPYPRPRTPLLERAQRKVQRFLNHKERSYARNQEELHERGRVVERKSEIQDWRVMTW